MGKPSHYDRHLCAQNPEQFALGFANAEGWLGRHSEQDAAIVHNAIATSRNRAWRHTALSIGFRPSAYAEGLALGIYGIKALERIGA